MILRSGPTVGASLRGPRISVVPPHPRYAENALFEGRLATRNLDAGRHPHAPNLHWMDYCIAFRNKARLANLTVATADILAVDDADVLMVMGVPASPRQTRQLRARRPDLAMILVTLETMMGRGFMFNDLNTEVFDAIITYETRVTDGRRYYPLRPRAYYRCRMASGAPFEQRRVGCFIASQQPLHRQFGLRAFRNGWRFRWSDWRDYLSHRGELLTYRAAVARHFSQYPANTFDLYGVGWNDDPKTHSVCRGVPQQGVLPLIGNYRFYFALENHESESSLISERIWDGLYGDAVPVYRGNKRLADYIPRQCYIDAAEFGDIGEMLDRLAAMKEDEWERYHQAGRVFLAGEAVEKFLPEAAAGDLLLPILQTLNRKGRAPA